MELRAVRCERGVKPAPQNYSAPTATPAFSSAPQLGEGGVEVAVDQREVEAAVGEGELDLGHGAREAALDLVGRLGAAAGERWRRASSDGGATHT